MHNCKCIFLLLNLVKIKLKQVKFIQGTWYLKLFPAPNFSIWNQKSTFHMYSSCYHYCTTSFNKSWTQVLRGFTSCLPCAGNMQWWEFPTIVPAWNRIYQLLLVNHSAKTIDHHHQQIYHLDTERKLTV